MIVVGVEAGLLDVERDGAVDELLTNADADPEQVERLRAAGLNVTLV